MIREYIIKISDEIMEEEIADRPQELVRCKNCKNRPDPHGTELNGEWYRWCEHLRRWVTDDWFCADGKGGKME